MPEPRWARTAFTDLTAGARHEVVAQTGDLRHRTVAVLRLPCGVDLLHQRLVETHTRRDHHAEPLIPEHDLGEDVLHLFLRRLTLLADLFEPVLRGLLDDLVGVRHAIVRKIVHSEHARHLVGRAER